MAVVVGLSFLVGQSVEAAKKFSEWSLPTSLGPVVNSRFEEIFDIYVSHVLANGSFGAALLITELCTPQDDLRPTIRPDGLELFFDSNRPSPPDAIGIGLRDLWVSTRKAISAPWSSPVNLGPSVNSGFNDRFPVLSSDGLTLIFASNRTGGLGGSDLYMSVRERAD